MPRTSKHIETIHPFSTDFQHLPRLPAATSVTKPQPPKSKSLQPCRCRQQGCGKMFSKRSNLKAHMRVHSGVLPYPCYFPGCTKRFRWKSSLKPHIRVHLASAQFLTQTSLSNTAFSSELPTNPKLSLTYARNQTAQPSNSPLSGELLDVRERAPVSHPSDQLGGQSSTDKNTPDASGWSDNTEQLQGSRRRVESSFDLPNQPPVSRILFEDSHDQAKLNDQGEIDLSSDSVLSSSAASYETDDVSFSLDSPPMEERDNSTCDKNLAEQLWKSDIQVIDPFGELSMVVGESNISLLSGLDGSTGVSANSMEAHPTDSQWIFSVSGSTVSSTGITSTLNSFSM